MFNYKDFFKRNYGIFTDSEQNKIRNARILIVGVGGIGGTVAIILARCGLSRFILVDFDDYDASNMNRQIGCFTNTLGQNKCQVIRDQITKINPEAEVDIYPRFLTNAQIAAFIPKADMVFPAADDFAFSLMVFRDCQRLGKPALMVVPSGTWANVSVIMPNSPPAEDIHGVPRLSTYDKLKEVFELRRYKFGNFYNIPFADWRIDYFRSFMDEDFPVPQICPIVWLSSSLGAFEILKVISEKRGWEPVISPNYWIITGKGIKITSINGFSFQTFLVWQRKILWHIFQTKMGGQLLDFSEKMLWRLICSLVPPI
ncbi:MAG: ThiF family adenylyltransferase [Desulfobacterales bacterium]|nr:ThiF family adenylyltransferase [Desulfobacterales bacterium]